MLRSTLFVLIAGSGLAPLAAQAPAPGLEAGFRNPPVEARPHAYWLWLNGYVHPESARADLEEMKKAGFGGVLMFDMGARGEKHLQPPPGPAFLDPAWMKQFREAVNLAKRLRLQFDFSVVSSWDLGGHWIQPQHASMGLYPMEAAVEGGKAVDVELPFPLVPPAAPKGPDGKPAFWRDVAVLAIRDAARLPGHDIVFRLDPEGVHDLREAVLDNGSPRADATLAATMTPTREFSVAVSSASANDADFREVLRGTLPAAAGPRRLPFPAGTKARYVRLRLLSGHAPARPRWTLGEFAVYETQGTNPAAARAADTRRNGALIVRATAPLAYDQEWNQDNLHDGSTEGPGGVFSTAGPPPFAFPDRDRILDVTDKVDRAGRLKWNAPPGQYTILRYVAMNTGERLKVPSPNSDGWATDHLSAEATRAHMDYVIARLRESFPDLKTSGITNLYLASYEVRGPVWAPGFTEEFRKRRGYDMPRFLPAVFGAVVGGYETTARFLFDYRKALGEVLVDAYYRAAREAANKAGLAIKSEAGGPGPPVHNVPVDALLANSAVDAIQGEFWPFWPHADGLWVVKETASAGHIYGKRRVHMEAFTSMQSWGEGPQDLKPSADRVFCEGGNHMVWHTWTHIAPEAGLPGWAYYAGTHVSRAVTWWPKIRPFVEYLSRSSFLLQRGNFVGDVLYYYGDGGYNFVGPRRNRPTLGPGYDYDYINADALLNRLSGRGNRLTLPDGTSYSVLVLPEGEDIHPAVLAKVEQLAAGGATVIGPKPRRASGLEGYPASDERVRALADKMWAGPDGAAVRSRAYGKGRIAWGVPEREILLEMGHGPDFTSSDKLDYIHRRDQDVDIYFVRNKTAAAVKETATFRVKGRAPELWDPVAGSIAPAPVYRAQGAGAAVELDLPANGSVFVVFRRPAPAKPGAAPSRAAHPPALFPIEGPWAVEFEKDRGAPAGVTLPALASWTDHADPGVRHFSGTARYRKTFMLPANWKRPSSPVWLDLGDLWNIGEVWLNSKPLGVVWTQPFRVDASAALREGANELAVEVTNTWHNRLVGDAGLPPDKRITRTNVPMTMGKPWAKADLLRSGLFGPVRLVAE